MIFKSQQVAAQWDTWCYHHAGTWYLYYLITESSAGEGFGVATSADGVHWEDHGWAIRASDDMVRYLGTGSVWRDPAADDRFLCNYSEWRLDDEGEPRQNILFAWSEDLLRWHKFGDPHLFVIDEGLYERYGRWDCINTLPRAAGGYRGTWTATPIGRRAGLRGGIGIGISDDGVHWRALPPATLRPDADESGAMVEVAGALHAMFGRDHTMAAYTAQHFAGPYRMAERNPLLLARNHAYFSRTFTVGDEVLVNHHAMDGRRVPSGRVITYAAPFKRFTVDEDGVQRWRWWPGNAALRGSEADPAAPHALAQGLILELTLDLEAEPRVALQVDGQPYLVAVHPDGTVDFSTDAAGLDWQRRHAADRQLGLGSEAACRVLVRRGMLELYLEDHFMECWTMGCAEATTVRLDPAATAGGSGARAWSMDLPEAG